MRSAKLAMSALTAPTTASASALNTTPSSPTKKKSTSSTFISSYSRVESGRSSSSSQKDDIYDFSEVSYDDLTYGAEAAKKSNMELCPHVPCAP